MSFNIPISENGKHLICRVSAPITTGLALERARALDRLSRETGIKRFLNDVCGSPNVSSTMKNYDFAYKEIPGIDFQRGTRSAILADADDRSHDFVETVSLNAGYNVRLFNDEDAAIAWLNELEIR